MDLRGRFARLASAGHLRHGALAVALAGGAWALLCLWLDRGGHAPSVRLLPIERYYLAQAAFVLPLSFALWGLCSFVSHRVARALGGRGDPAGTANALGVALGVPLLVAFVAPDLVAYAALGFDALGTVVRVSAPLSFAITLWLATRALQAAHALSTPRSFAAAAAGVCAQAAVGSVFLR